MSRHSLRTLIRDLHRRRGRERRKLALAEGVRLVEEALAVGLPIRGVVVSPALEGTSRGRALKAALLEAGVIPDPAEDRELVELADTEHPQGILAVIEPREWTWADLAPRPGAVVLVLDGVQDPGNVGTIVRTAHGLGAAGVVALKGTAELTNPKALRASMGSLFRFPAFSADDAELFEWCDVRNVGLWVSAMDGQPIRPAPDRAVALVLGNEGAGVRPGLEDRASRRVGIPLAPGAESLNVAVAAGILLYEVTRGT